jgi:hypothetical protein
VAYISHGRRALDTAEGAKGERVDFLRTFASHGVAELPPNELSLEERTLVTTLSVGGMHEQSESELNADTNLLSDVLLRPTH